MKKEFGFASKLALALALGAVCTASVFAGTVTDTDGDGVPDTTESGPAGTNPLYDGNGDTIPDLNQGSVASMQSAPGPYVTLALVQGGTRFTQATPNFAPATFPSGVNQFPIGIFRTTIVDQDGPGASGFQVAGVNLVYVEFDIIVHDPVPALTSYWKYNDGLAPAAATGYSAFNYPNFGPNPLENGGFAPGSSLRVRLYDDPSGTSNGALYPIYGDANPVPFTISDPSGPGSGTPLLVDLTSLTAAASANGVTLSWTTAAEVNNAGFNVYSFDGTSLTKANASLIAAEGVDGAGASYSYEVVGGSAAGSYYLEDIDLSGARTLHGPVSAGAAATVSDWSMF